jgi:TolA-binding protein
MCSVAVSVMSAVGCATTPAPVVPTTDVAPPSSTDAELQALRARVTTLERRLVDIDNRLALGGVPASIAPAPMYPSPASTQSFGMPVSGDIQSGATIDLVRSDEYDDQGSFGATTAPASAPASSPASSPPATSSAPRSGRGYTQNANGEIVITDATMGRTPAEANRKPAANVRVEQLYAEAHDRLKARDVVAAKRIFDGIVAQHKTHGLADNALYWSAECLRMSGEHQAAIDVWRKLPREFPRSPKIPDALFGMAMAHEALGNIPVARTLYAELVAAYPAAERRAEAQAALSRLPPS